MEYRNRIADKLLSDKLSSKGAVLIEGPKWCGKTTTAKQQCNSLKELQHPVYGKSYLNDAYSVVLNEKDKFLVGDPLGVSFTSSNKYLQQEYIVTLLTAVALSGKKWKKDRLDVNIVLGCPVEVYDYQKKSAKESAMNLGPQSITIGDSMNISNSSTFSMNFLFKLSIFSMEFFSTSSIFLFNSCTF